MVTVHPINSPNELQAVHEAAKMDDHDAFGATHYVMKEGDIVGFFNVGFMVNWWMHTQKCNRTDSENVRCAMEGMMRQAGLKAYRIACAKNSPYFSRMKELGYKKLFETVVFHRNI